MARKLLDLAKDKIETLFGKIEDNFAELYQDKTQKDQEIQSLATGVNNAKSIYGLTDPLVTTAASYIGQQYTNTITGDQFTCVNISGDDQKTYTWLPSNSAVLQTIRDAMNGKVDWSKFSNPNLLDNWYFINPINQLGIVSGDAIPAGYFLDRWYNIEAAPATWVDGEGIKFANLISNVVIEQQIEKELIPIGTIVTASILFSLEGESSLHLVSVTGNWGSTVFSEIDSGVAANLNLKLATGNPMFRIRIYTGHPTITVKAAKLEIGEKQTLAIQNEDGELVLADLPPDPTSELLKCYRYLRVLNAVGYKNHSFGLGFSINNQIRIPYILPMSMRATPVVSFSGTFLAYKSTDTATSQALNVTSVNAVGLDEESMLIRAYVDGSPTGGDIYLLRSGVNDAGKIILDANL